MMRLPTKCRAIVVAKDGHCYPTRWFPCKPYAQLGPDEMPAWIKAKRAADQIVERLGLEVKAINGQFVHPKGT